MPIISDDFDTVDTIDKGEDNSLRSKFPKMLDRIEDTEEEWGYICKSCIKELKVPKSMLMKPKGSKGYCSVNGCRTIGYRFITFES